MFENKTYIFAFIQPISVLLIYQLMSYERKSDCDTVFHVNNRHHDVKAIMQTNKNICYQVANFRFDM